MERKEYARAERLFREALQIYAATLPPDHLSVGISRARLGSTLAAEHRYSEAEVESRAGYEILSKKASPSIKWLQIARHDLATEYQALNQPDKAVKFREPIAKP